MARALSKLGVHTQNDVERLTERVDALSEAVNELIKGQGNAGAKGAICRARTKGCEEGRGKKAAGKSAKESAARGVQCREGRSEVERDADHICRCNRGARWISAGSSLVGQASA